MKYLILIALYLFSFAVYSQENQKYFFGDYIPLKLLKCDVSQTFLDSLVSKFDFSNPMSKYSKLHDFIPVNINKTSECEYLLIYSSSLLSKPMITDIIEVDDKEELVVIGSFLGRIHFTKSTTDYLKIVEPYCEGHKTNCTFYPNEFIFNGTSYISSKLIKVNRGTYQTRGKEAYDKEDFSLAKKYFNNAFLTSTAKPGPALKAANDLALVLYILGDLNTAEELLSERLRYYSSNKLESTTYYNLGLINERQGDLNEALRCYSRANKLDFNNKIKEKIESLKNDH